MKAGAVLQQRGTGACHVRHSALQQNGPPVLTLPQPEGWMQDMQASAPAATEANCGFPGKKQKCESLLTFHFIFIFQISTSN